MPPANLQKPYTIEGTVLESDEVTPAPSAMVTVTNLTRGGEETVTSKENGDYLVDLANYTNGYAHLDSIKVYVVRGGDIAIVYTTVILE